MKYFSFLLIILIFIQCFTAELKQERAMMNFCNPEYLAACYGITRRLRRGEPYRTNFTITSRYASGNNVTLRVVLYGAMTVELLKVKLCDITKVDWLFTFFKTYGKIDDKCPYKAGSYGLLNLELPPKHLPRSIQMLLEGKFYAKFFFLLTKTDEILLEATITLHAS